MAFSSVAQQQLVYFQSVFPDSVLVQVYLLCAKVGDTLYIQSYSYSAIIHTQDFATVRETVFALKDGEGLDVEMVSTYYIWCNSNLLIWYSCL